MKLVAILFLLSWLGMVYILFELMGTYSWIITLPSSLFIGYYAAVISEIK